MEIKNTHFWQIDFSNIVGTVDVRVRRDANEQFVLKLVTEKLSSVVNRLSVQVNLLFLNILKPMRKIIIK